MKKTLFISDLHLDEQHQESVKLFINLLKACPGKVEVIYILGDLFEAWIGDDDNTGFNQKIIAALKQTSEQGIKFYFMHGNRDFLVGKSFASQSGCELLGEEEKISLYGENVLLMHGDSICTDDKQYMRLRKITSKRLFQKLFLILPLSFRQNIAKKLREYSKQVTQKKHHEIMDVSQKSVEKVMLKHECNTLIHGHTHRPDIHHFKLHNQAASRIVLGDWHNGISMLVCDDNGNRSLLAIAPDQHIVF